MTTSTNSDPTKEAVERLRSVTSDWNATSLSMLCHEAADLLSTSQARVKVLEEALKPCAAVLDKVMGPRTFTERPWGGVYADRKDGRREVVHGIEEWGPELLIEAQAARDIARSTLNEGKPE